MRVDLHMHTGYSADAQYPQSIDDKIHACEQAGLDIIGITDHLDFLRSGGTRDNRDPEACAREVWEKRRPAGNGGIEVLAGMEIGQLHAMPNDLDIYFHDFPNMDCDKFLHEYFDQLLLLEEHGGFDVLAHIDYPLRVMKHGDYIPSFDNYMDRVQQVLRLCIDHGYALELNAAGIAGWQKKVGPPQNILYEYKRMGGERISIGSDSHTLDTVARGVDNCVKNALDAGFTHVTVFRERKPVQIALK